MNLLLICDLFPPAFGPRMGYLCKYLQHTDWHPTVLTEQIMDDTFSILTGYAPVTYVDFYPAKQAWMRQLQWTGTFLFGTKEEKMYQAASQLIRRQPFELVLCSSYRTFPLQTAARIAHELQVPLIVDLRDIIEQYTGMEFISQPLPRLFGLEKWIAAVFKKRSLQIRNRILRQAAAVITVSPWHVKTLKAFNPNTHLIYNGFDPELFHPEICRTNRFLITYTGRLLSTAMRDPGLLFDALRQLRKTAGWNPAQCGVQWYVDADSEKIIRAEADKAGVAEFMEYKGYVPAKEIPQILNHSSVLLLLTNRSANNGPKGVMTTKFFEALATGRPILCVRSDEDCLENALQETEAGLAGRDVEHVCRFLLEKWTEWKTNGFTTNRTRQEGLELYSRKGQAAQFVHLFESVLTH
ncbi:MAG: glycosyltransferase [Parabacteroides sp.]